MDPDTVAKMRAIFGGGAPPPQGMPQAPIGMAQHLQPPTPQPSPPGGLMAQALGGGMQPQGPPTPTTVPYTAPQGGMAGPGGPPTGMQQPMRPPPPPIAPPSINPQAPPPSGAKGALQGVAGVLAELGNMKQIPQFHDAQFSGYAHPQPGFAPNVGPVKLPRNY